MLKKDSSKRAENSRQSNGRPKAFKLLSSLFIIGLIMSANSYSLSGAAAAFSIENRGLSPVAAAPQAPVATAEHFAVSTVDATSSKAQNRGLSPVGPLSPVALSPVAAAPQAPVAPAADAATAVDAGAVLAFNLQNFTVLTDTAHDWYTGARPPQKGLYQINAAYSQGEGAVFTFAKTDSRADPMIHLPVYDICYNMNLRNYPVIAVCYKSTATNNRGSLYFATAANAGLGEDKNVGISLPPTESWSIATASAANNGNWTGRLTQLRFDVASGEFSGAITVRWIGFFRSESDAVRFGVDGNPAKNAISPEKTVYDRGEPISFSVTNAVKSDWVVLVQKGDACYAPSTHEGDLYISSCMPLYWTEIEDGKGTIDIDVSRGIYNRRLLPAGEYDLVYLPRGRYVETGRTTITITDNVVREPKQVEKIIVTRGPASTEEPDISASPATETAPPEPTAKRTGTTAKPSSDSHGGSAAGPVIGIVTVLCCAAALTAFFVARRRRK